MSLHYDENTLAKVYLALARAGMTITEARGAITEMQNAGILFRERARDEGVEHVERARAWLTEELPGVVKPVADALRGLAAWAERVPLRLADEVDKAEQRKGRQ